MASVGEAVLKVKVELAEVERLSLKPGDAIAVNFPGLVTNEQANHVIEQVRRILHMPDLPVLVLSDGARITVVEDPAASL